MISTETRKFLLKLILVCLYSISANGCDSNKKLYTEIGCKPIYSNDSNSCPVAYNCENVFTRPNDKCYFNGNVYEPKAELSKTDSALNPCLASCYCNQPTPDNENAIATFRCANVECPSYFARLREPCYYQYKKDLCCEVNKICPEEKSIVHECTYDGNTYKNGQQFYVGDFLRCVCSPEFNGAASDSSCRKIGCNYEILYLKNIVKRSAPVYFEKVDGCPVEWYHPEYNNATIENTTPSSKTSSNSYTCKYGDLSVPLGQKLTFSQQSDSHTYDTTCSCNTPPLVTCIKVRKNSN